MCSGATDANCCVKSHDRLSLTNWAKKWFVSDLELVVSSALNFLHVLLLLLMSY